MKILDKVSANAWLRGERAKRSRPAPLSRPWSPARPGVKWAPAPWEVEGDDVKDEGISDEVLAESRRKPSRSRVDDDVFNRAQPHELFNHNRPAPLPDPRSSTGSIRDRHRVPSKKEGRDDARPVSDKEF
jgi:hypothetical protein